MNERQQMQPVRRKNLCCKFTSIIEGIYAYGRENSREAAEKLQQIGSSILGAARDELYLGMRFWMWR